VWPAPSTTASIAWPSRCRADNVRLPAMSGGPSQSAEQGRGGVPNSAAPDPAFVEQRGRGRSDDLSGHCIRVRAVARTVVVQPDIVVRSTPHCDARSDITPTSARTISTSPPAMSSMQSACSAVIVTLNPCKCSNAPRTRRALGAAASAEPHAPIRCTRLHRSITLLVLPPGTANNGRIAPQDRNLARDARAPPTSTTNTPVGATTNSHR
jgi:hypothetical protein